MAAPKNYQDWLSSMQGMLALPSSRIDRLVRQYGLNWQTMQPEDLHRVAVQDFAPGPQRQVELPLGPSAAEPEIRSLIPMGRSGPGVPVGGPSGPGVPVGGPSGPGVRVGGVSGPGVRVGGVSGPGVPLEPVRHAFSGQPMRGEYSPMPAGTTKARGVDPFERYHGEDGNPGDVPEWLDEASRAAWPNRPPRQGLPYDPYVPVRNQMADAPPVPGDPDMSLGSPMWDQMNKASRSYEGVRSGRTANLRNQQPGLVQAAQANINQGNAAAQARQAAMPQQDRMGLALGAGALGVATAAASYGLNRQPQQQARASAPKAAPGDLTETGNPADLSSLPEPQPADEGLPPDEQKFVDSFKRGYVNREERRRSQPPAAPTNYSDQAKAMLDDLNLRRRQAGGEVPDAPQVMSQANALLAKSNAQRNDPSFTAGPNPSLHEQAQMLLQKVNALNAEAGSWTPESQRLFAEVQRLQKLGDEQRWSGSGATSAPPPAAPQKPMDVRNRRPDANTYLYPREGDYEPQRPRTLRRRSANLS